MKLLMAVLSYEIGSNASAGSEDERDMCANYFLPRNIIIFVNVLHVLKKECIL